LTKAFPLSVNFAEVAAGLFLELIDAWDGSYKDGGMSAIFDRVLTLNPAANTAIF
jgi:hypothetical protein